MVLLFMLIDYDLFMLKSHSLHTEMCQTECALQNVTFEKIQTS